MGSEFSSQNFDLAKFQEINSGAFFFSHLASEFLQKSESLAKLTLARNFGQLPSRVWA